MTIRRKKLIEVSMPLEAINKASGKEKSIRHGHPSTLHLWWARRPLAACRAVLFGQLVDDPSSWPEEFPTTEEQERERARLHSLIGEMVPWEATNNEPILTKARFEIARSIARGRGDELPASCDGAAILAYLAEHAPPVCDPFCGGGSIPLEAQRLGLRAHGSDINPVAVLVSKATCEIPPKFAERPPVNPERDPHVVWKGAQGLAEDIRYYGKWMRDEAEARIGQLYPKVKVTRRMADERKDLKPLAGKDLTVVAWLWARTVASPDPMMRGAHVPLTSTFILSSKKGKESWIEFIQDSESPDGWRFESRTGTIPRGRVRDLKNGTKVSQGSFRCALSGAPIPYAYIDEEANAGRMRSRLMAVVAQGERRRIYFSPDSNQEAGAFAANPSFRPSQAARGTFASNAQGRMYGFHSFGDYFADRQLVALTTFSELVTEARRKVLDDAYESGMSANGARLAEGGVGASAYADAVATYLGLGVGRACDYWSVIATWVNGGEFIRNTFARQGIAMTWDFAEGNPFSSGSGNWENTALGWIVRVVRSSSTTHSLAGIIQQDAAGTTELVDNAIVATDPPYYDNIEYADLADFFYVWQRQTLKGTWPDLFRRVLVPKDEELVATPYRHGGAEAADQFFMDGMARALRKMHRSGRDDFPITVYYAFKQAEVEDEGLTSPGWATFLQAVFNAGFGIHGTWPVRTERSARSVGIGTNALASSIVLVCSKRSEDASTLTRREFVAQLRRVLPDALEKIRAGGVGPVDMAQASMGPGMGVFTAAARVLEPDDTPMTVRTAIALINQVRDEISGEEATSYDADTRFCIDWFDAFGFEEGDSGGAITMAQAYNIGIGDLEAAGVFSTQGGRARLLQRDELEDDWDPSTDARLTDWECAQHLARVLEAEDGGIEAAARLYARMDSDRSDSARMLAYRIYDICERRNRAQEAQIWNMLAQEWAALEAAAAAVEDPGGSGTIELDLAGGS